MTAAQRDWDLDRRLSGLHEYLGTTDPTMNVESVSKRSVNDAVARKLAYLDIVAFDALGNALRTKHIAKKFLLVADAEWLQENEIIDCDNEIVDCKITHGDSVQLNVHSNFLLWDTKSERQKALREDNLSPTATAGAVASYQQAIHDVDGIVILFNGKNGRSFERAGFFLYYFRGLLAKLNEDSPRHAKKLRETVVMAAVHPSSEDERCVVSFAERCNVFLYESITNGIRLDPASVLPVDVISCSDALTKTIGKVSILSLMHSERPYGDNLPLHASRTVDASVDTSDLPPPTAVLVRYAVLYVESYWTILMVLVGLVGYIITRLYVHIR